MHAQRKSESRREPESGREHEREGGKEKEKENERKRKSATLQEMHTGLTQRGSVYLAKGQSIISSAKISMLRLANFHTRYGSINNANPLPKRQ